MKKTQLAATVYLTHEKTGRVLLIHNKKLDMWLPPGGQAEPGELPSECAYREFQEEVGIDLREHGYHPFPGNPSPATPEAYLGYLEQFIGDTWFLIHTFHFYTTAEEPKVRIDLNEVYAYAWVNPLKFDPEEYPTTPNVTHIVRSLPWREKL